MDQDNKNHNFTLAERVILKGKNVAVKPCFERKNYCYVNAWNKYAEEKNLWVKFIDEVPSGADNYEIIEVGFPSHSPGF